MRAALLLALLATQQGAQDRGESKVGRASSAASERGHSLQSMLPGPCVLRTVAGG